MQAVRATQPSAIVYQARASLNETQREFAARVNSTQSLICKYELGAVAPPASLLIQCLNLLGMPTGEVSEEDLVRLVTERLSGGHMALARQAVAQLIHCLPAKDAGSRTARSVRWSRASASKRR